MNSREKAAIRALQDGIKFVERPFSEAAAQAGMSEEELLSIALELKESGVIRRFGAAVRHREIGYAANAMTVWSVPDHAVEDAGRVMASYDQISHCYERPTFPGFPYNLYAMIHGHTREEVEALVAEIEARTGIRNYRVLFSVRELKKAGMRYFEEE